MNPRDNFAEIVPSRHPGSDNFHEVVAILRGPGA
jgi:hypothetical protein